jgi:hypothetical protein
MASSLTPIDDLQGGAAPTVAERQINGSLLSKCLPDIAILLLTVACDRVGIEPL